MLLYIVNVQIIERNEFYMIVIGIDIGGTITKIIGIKDGVQMNPLQVKATDPVTSLYGALGRYMNENNLELSDISCTSFWL